MTGTQNPESTLAVTKDLLLKDYGYRADSLWKSEQAGETRVQFFIAFATVVGAGLGFFVKENAASGQALRYVVLGWLFALLVVGLITFARMIVRNEHTDKCKLGLDAIRQVFKDIDSEGLLVHYYPVEPPNLERPLEVQAWWTAVQPRKFGGLAHTVAAINALIVGAMLVVAVNPAGMGAPLLAVSSLEAAFGCGFGAAAVAFAAQLAYIASRAAKARQRLRKGYATHAGGVVVRLRDGVVQYLLVPPKDRNSRVKWVLPKGHIEDGEGHGEAALREVREEAGVVARLAGLVARVEFEVAGEHVDCKFYLMEHLFDVESKEKRDVRWLPFDAARAELTHPEGRYALEQAHARREAGG